MWTMQFSVRLQCDEAPEEVVEITVTEYMDEWPGLEQWEQNVRDVGFRAMREMLAGGFQLREHTLLRTWTHRDDDCQLARHGRTRRADQHGWKGAYRPSAAVLQAVQGVDDSAE